MCRLCYSLTTPNHMPAHRGHAACATTNFRLRRHELGIVQTPTSAFGQVLGQISPNVADAYGRCSSWREFIKVHPSELNTCHRVQFASPVATSASANQPASTINCLAPTAALLSDLMSTGCRSKTQLHDLVHRACCGKPAAKHRF